MAQILNAFRPLLATTSRAKLHIATQALPLAEVGQGRTDILCARECGCPVYPSALRTAASVGSEDNNDPAPALTITNAEADFFQDRSAS